MGKQARRGAGAPARQQPPQPPASRPGLFAGSAAVAAAAAAAGVAASAWRRPSPGTAGEDSAGAATAAPASEGTAATSLEALRAVRGCGQGAPGSWSEVPTLDLSELRGLRLTSGGVRCPLVITGLGATDGWQELLRWGGDFEEMERRSPTTMAFDESATGSFTYWDNATALNAAVRTVGSLRQGYRKVEAPRRAFFNALKRDPAGAAAQPSGFGAVRYGGQLKRLSPELARAATSWASAIPAFGPSSREPSLWLSSAGSYSTAHYDSWHNIFVMLHGEKSMLLSPPADVRHFRVHPGTHPLARQARSHFGAPAAADAAAEAGEGAPKREEGRRWRLPQELGPVRVMEANVRPGEALFIPAGWLHHVTATSSSSSLALTALTREHTEFNAFVGDAVAMMPFLTAPGATNAPLQESLTAFVPALLEALGYQDPTADSDPLQLLLNSSYGPETRRELGWPARLAAFDCPKVTKPTAKVARRAASEVAKRFKSFDEDLRELYLAPYLDTVLSRVGGEERDAGNIMRATVSFVESCLLPARARSAMVMKAYRAATKNAA